MKRKFTDAQLNSVVKKSRAIDKKIKALQSEQAKLTDKLIAEQERFEDRWFWLDQHDCPTPKQRQERRELEKYLNRLDSAENKICY